MSSALATVTPQEALEMHEFGHDEEDHSDHLEALAIAKHHGPTEEEREKRLGTLEKQIRALVKERRNYKRNSLVHIKPVVIDEEDIEDTSKWGRTKQSCSDLCGSTTMHGGPNAYSSTLVCMRVWWLLLVLGSAGFLIYLM